MARTRRELLAGSAGLIAATALGPRAVRAQALRKLVVGDVSHTAASWHLVMAQSAGIYAQEKLEVEYVYTGNNATVAQQLVGSSLDLGITTIETAIRAVENGAPIVMVSSGMLKFPYSFMAAPSIAKPSDLKGKKVILDLPKSFLSYLWRKWETANGVDPDDVEVVYDGSSTNRFAALAAGVVVVAPVTQPLDVMAVDRGFKKLIEVGTYPAARNFGFTCLAARKEWLPANGDVLRSFLRAEARGIDYLYDPKNRDQSIAALVDFAKIEAPIATKTYEYYMQLRPYAKGAALPDAYVASVADYLVASGDVKGPVPVAKYVDHRFLPR